MIKELTNSIPSPPDTSGRGTPPSQEESQLNYL